MKNLFFLTSFAALTIFLGSCYDNFRLNDDSLPIEKDIETVYFSDYVLDKNDKPLSDVEVAIYAAGERYSDKTRFDGQYVIKVPAKDLPKMGYISLSMTKDEFIPYNSTYEAPLPGGQVYKVEDREFRLDPCDNCLEIGDKSSELYHLGDDNYGGPENSQFQKTTDGVEIDIQLKDSDDYGGIEISFEVKGIQPSSFSPANHGSVQFYAGNDLVAEEFISEDSPEDGSFGVYKMTVDNSKTINNIKFVTRNRGVPDSDYDDWEFTCLYVIGDN